MSERTEFRTSRRLILSAANPPAPPPTSSWLKDVLVALSLANLVLINTWFPLLFDKDSSYFNQLPVGTPTLLALAANYAWLTLAFGAALRLRHRTANRLLLLAIHAALFALLFLPLEFLRIAVLEIADYQVVALLKRPWAALALLSLSVAALWYHRALARVVVTLLGILSPLALLNVARVLLLLFGITHLRQSTEEPALAPLRPAAPDMPRVVWIIFDELDQRLGFAEPPAHVSLPEFDRLRAESVYATNAFPPGGSTLISMPALTTGWPVSAATANESSDLALTGPDGQQARWRELPSVFSRAVELGANTGLVGWYHPYSRVLGPHLTYCTWFPYPNYEPARARTFGAAAIRQLRNTVPALHLRSLHIDLCQRSLQEACALAANPDCHLMLLHLAPPHKPGVYLPATDRFTIFGMPKTEGYFNNLILADRSLGQIREAVHASGAADRTWIILSSDHWWRDSAVHDGKTDPRVPLLLRPPASTTGEVYGGIIHTLRTGDLALDILRRQVRTTDDVVAWLNRHQSDQPPALGLTADQD